MESTKTAKLIKCLDENDTKGCSEIYFPGDWESTINWERIQAYLNMGIRDEYNDNQMNLIAYTYNYGLGIETNLKKAFEWYTKAAEAGNYNAMNNLAYAYDCGEGVEKDIQKAFELFLKGATLGDITAMYNVGMCYKNGSGTEKDVGKAFEWTWKTILLGDRFAIPTLGKHYSKQMFGEIQKLISQNNKLISQNNKLKEENLELSLRPPEIGGSEYIKAQKRFYENA